MIEIVDRSSLSAALPKQTSKSPLAAMIQQTFKKLNNESEV